MLTFTELSTWLQAFVDVPIAEGPTVPEAPDRLIILTPTGGPGLSMELAMDTVSWQVRCRGGQRNEQDAVDLAVACDRAICLHRNVAMGATLVNVMGRVGAPPTSLGQPDDAYRYEMGAQYYFSYAY